MVEPFDLNGQHGQAGDYIVKRAEHQWIVAREIFEAAYLLVEERSV